MVLLSPLIIPTYLCRSAGSSNLDLCHCGWRVSQQSWIHWP